jgi:hypothetical protein
MNFDELPVRFDSRSKRQKTAYWLDEARRQKGRMQELMQLARA